MNDLARSLAAKAIQEDPGLEAVFDEFQAQQQELFRLLELMGVRHVAIEIPPAANADAILRTHVSSTRR